MPAGKLSRVKPAGTTAERSLPPGSVTVVVPKVKKKYRKRGALPVTFTRDGVRADNTLAFDYVKP